MAAETMVQYLWRPQNQADHENLRVERQGGFSWYNHLNMSWWNQKRLHFHVSFGATYTQNLLIENKDTLNYTGAFFDQTVNPDFSLSVDWRTKPWISTHFTASYGTTFVYLDNIPRKYQLSYGFRIATFYKMKAGFLKNFRAEFIGFYMYLPDAKETIESILPIFPYFYWQWTFKSKKK